MNALITKLPAAVMRVNFFSPVFLKEACNQLQNKINSKTNSESILIQKDQCKHLLKSGGIFQLCNF